MKRAITPLAAAVAAAFAAAACGAVFAQGDAAGPAKARSCTPCHGPLGLASAPDAPHLAGQPEMYLSAQLRAYRSGARQHPVMNVIAKPLSDEDIGALSAWFSRQKIEMQAP